MTTTDQTPYTQSPFTQSRPLARRLPEITHDRNMLRGVMGKFATGITVVTAGQTPPRGMTANSFTSVSLQPALVLVCVLREAAMHDVILDCESFAVSVLSAQQEEVARHFANHRRPRGEAEFEVIDSTAGKQTGAPILADALAWLECRLDAVYDGGDHSIFLGEVLDMGHGSESDALLFYGGSFHRLETAVPDIDG
jgi:flavin reductase